LKGRAAYYRRDLALVHHLGYGFHADACAPGILALLESVRERRGLVLELGCGSGTLTRHLVEAGHRVVATDASSRPTPRRTCSSWPGRLSQAPRSFAS
jgi:2-polyprenyl-3-methyl-5-hydroxy-6-metoxy-1,4-benzoquinol methylase